MRNYEEVSVNDMTLSHQLYCGKNILTNNGVLQITGLILL